MITSTSSAAWTSAAPCAGVDGYVPSEELMRSKPREVLEECVPLLEGCVELCPFVLRCYERVRPEASRFDGVCAGRMWVNGKVVATAEGAPVLPKLLSQAGTCGTSSGVKAHRRLGEPLCGECRVTAQRAGVRRAGAASIRKRASRSDRRTRVAS
ncbi:hypothetical protein GCM10010339_60640 [Streptomyces alanosinicus]|uniref:4Fe-4S Wbl-type domain-containing protein n=1 Tax=Streptomyces alanosinicus TaxID=68171 RepID=A0A918YMY8_9ACTN|nr:hypothetical protein GCM10010339_60640 [Streptomyces alanosinicus]